MKKYQMLFGLVVIILYLFQVYIDYSSLNKNKKAYLEDLSMNLVDINKSISFPLTKLQATSFKYWGLRRSSLLRKREEDALKRKFLSKKSDSSIKMIKNFKLTDRTICLENKCWEFMGIIKIDNQTQVTLLSKEKKQKLKTFKVGSSLLENLDIVEISSNRMVLFDRKKKKRFYLKLFDVDISRYYPKPKLKLNKKELNE